MYSRNIHDSSLPFTIQTMSAKLLLNLVECIARKNDINDPKGTISEHFVSERKIRKGIACSNIGRTCKQIQQFEKIYPEVAQQAIEEPQRQ